MAKRIQKRVNVGKLSASLIDEFSEHAAEVLKETKLSSKDILRFRISVETAMGTWLEEIGEGAECVFEVTKKFGRISIAVSCEGEMCNPQKEAGEGFGELADSALLQSLGLSVGYKYDNGVNRLRFMPNSGVIMQLAPIIIAFVLGIGLALVLKTATPDSGVFINKHLVDPIFTAMMNMLRTIAGPLIFLAVLNGIYGIGDISALGKIGKKLIQRFIGMTYFTLIITLGFLAFMVKFDSGTFKMDSSVLGDFMNLILQFIPTDIISPFLNGNMLQIITLAVAAGIVILILGELTKELTGILNQLFAVVQLLMEAIGRLVPIFIFISMMSLILSDIDVSVSSIVKPAVAVVGTFVMICLIVYPLILMRKYRIGYMNLMKKLLPTFIIAITTASSPAAFSTNIETCEKELGIPNNLSMFGVPVGQVVYMPLAASEYLALAMILADAYNVTITPMWIITAVLVCGILAIATPPIPGGSLSIFTIMFIQLGIPEIALPIAIGLDLLIDYIATAGDLMCLQEEMVLCADRTGVLNKEVLLKEKK